MSYNFDPDALDREYARRQAESNKAGTPDQQAPKPRATANKPKKNSIKQPIALIRFFKDRRTKMFAA